jgi:hypothetical protein
MVKNFKFSELTKTSVKLNNVPEDMEVVGNIYHTAVKLQRLRDLFKGAIRVNSCYRSSAVNVAVKGAKDSAHIRGMAADICAYSGKAADNNALWQLVTAHLQDMDIDQAICYTLDGTLGTAIKWIHIGFTDGVPRHQILYK